jgi:hypothetical protein
MSIDRGALSLSAFAGRAKERRSFMLRRILALTLAFGVVAATMVKADAHGRRHHHRHHHFARSSHGSHRVSYVHGGFSLVTVTSAAGPITVNAAHASQFIGAIADLVAAGFRGPVHCYARGGHVRHSLHYTGEACDFAQLRRNVVAPGARIMYHAHTILARWGLRDGCTFHDCGHADTGRIFAAVTRERYAEARRRRYAQKSERHRAENPENAELWAWHDGSQDKTRGRARDNARAKADGWWDDSKGRKDWDTWKEPRRVAEYRHPYHHRYR